MLGDHHQRYGASVGDREVSSNPRQCGRVESKSGTCERDGVPSELFVRLV